MLRRESGRGLPSESGNSSFPEPPFGAFFDLIFLDAFALDLGIFFSVMVCHSFRGGVVMDSLLLKPYTLANFL